MTDEKKVEQEILHNATELFLAKGFKSVTMDDLANEMGISKKTIYTHYKTKTDLVKASSEHIFNFIKNGIDLIRERELNPIEELYTINNFVYKHLKDDSSSPEFQLLKYYPKIHSTLNAKKFEAIHECCICAIDKGKKLGIFRNDIDPEIIMRFYFFSISEIKNQNLFPNEKFNAFNLINTYLDYHVRGIATQKGVDFLENLKSNLI